MDGHFEPRIREFLTDQKEKNVTLAALPSTSTSSFLSLSLLPFSLSLSALFLFTTLHGDFLLHLLAHSYGSLMDTNGTERDRRSVCETDPSI